jgi:hypothetical protein
MVLKPNFSNFPTMPVPGNADALEQAQRLWNSYEADFMREQAQIDAAYEQFQQQQTLISSLSLPTPTKPMTSRGRNFQFAPQGGTHRPVGAPQHVHAPDRAARRERRTKQDQIVQLLAVDDL